MAHFSFRLSISLVAASAGLIAGAQAASLKVTVQDAGNHSPIAAAWVQVGPGPGNPFAGNAQTTDAAGVALFNDPALIGAQTVTAAADGFARLTVIEAAADSITLRLDPEVAADATIPPPRAEISGTVSNIAVANNDGNLDIGIVYPAFRLGDILSGGALPLEAPPDTVTFPIVGQVVLPGNVVVPNQTEALFLLFSKPTYHFFVPDREIYDFLCLAGRLPLASLSSPDPRNAMAMREIGAERQIAVNGDRALTINSDIDLTRDLTVTMPEAVVGSEMQVFSVADIAEPQGTLTYFYDSKTGVAGVTSQLLLSGRNPIGDLATSVPFLAGVYGDSSAADAWQAGRVDRTPLTLPATRTIGQFFNLPDLTQTNDNFAWSNVARPGITPDPTWAVASFRLAPATPGDGTVTTRSLWEIWTPAGRGSFTLPVLDAGAPGGLIDPTTTVEADQLNWSQLLTDPAGSLQSVLDDAYSSATRFSRSATPIAVPVSAVSVERPIDHAGIQLLGPNPNPFRQVTRLELTLATGGHTTVRVYDVAGRLVKTLREGPAQPGVLSICWDGGGPGGARMPEGVYFVKAEVEGRSLMRRVVLR